MNTIIIGERYKEKLEKPLKIHGFEAFWLPGNPNVDPRLASHSDLSVFLYGKTAVLANYLKDSEIVKLLTKRGINVIISKETQNIKYPRDINLCALTVGERLLHNIEYTDCIIKEFKFTDFVHINQGYARCTALAVNENCIITADAGIADAAVKIGIDVLKIQKGFIKLDGFDEGFIGGAAFKAGDTIYFTGEINYHPDGKRIVDYIKERGLDCVCLTKEAPFDIGGAIYIA